MTSFGLRNIRPWGEPPVDLRIVDGRIGEIRPHDPTAPGDDWIDGCGQLALPGFANVHAHVDKSWWGLPWQSYGGEGGTQGRIAHERARRDELGIPGVGVTGRVLQEFLRHGTTRLRTHVDVDPGVGLRGIDVVRESAAAIGDAIQTAIVAFPQDGVLRRDGVVDLLRQAAQRGVEFIGGLDPTLIDHDPVGQVDALFDIAADTGVGLDLHLHAGDGVGLFEFDLILDRAEALGLRDRVTFAHGFAMAEAPPSRRAELLERMAALGVSMTTVAPIGRRQLPLHEFDGAGISLGLGTDGIRDLWSPYGDGDLLGIAWQFARASGFVRDADLVRVMRLATSDGARFVSDEVNDLVVGARADVVLLNAENPMDALVRRVPRSLVVAGGQVFHPADLDTEPWR